jgi:putative methyltransferase (TIGR04325 family)
MKQFIYSLLPKYWQDWYYYNIKYGWHGNYKSWQQALQNCTAYDADIIIEKVRQNALKVQKGEAVYERDGVLYNTVQYDYALLAALLYIASLHNNNLSVFDFGGALGTSYHQNKYFLQHLNSLHWSITEQPKFVTIGKNEFTTAQLHFYNTLDELLKEQHPNVALISSSQSYVEQPYTVMQQIADADFEFVIIDHTGFIDAPEDRLTIQKVPPFFYEASYPCWFFSKQKFLHFWQQQYEVITTFQSGHSFMLGNKVMFYEGMLLKKKY